MSNPINTNRCLFVSAQEVCEVLGISRAYAYRIIKELNDELSQKGYLTIHGKTNRKYFYQKIYGKDASNE
ncbi:helix-turn-helix domain-containing protein [Candidatus Avoscillospira sp. LCP25S3_F1]|uniref:helix-turn-helix domain-containing protein n=1 Tax=Candidatus Avoscillospira sp. LCP25S3_F1 TaxID=3438825 RepID=UPI003F8EF2A7